MEYQEDFEFKPLSDGLGFHPRQNDKKESDKKKETSDFGFGTQIKADGAFVIDESLSLENAVASLKKAADERPPRRSVDFKKSTDPRPNADARKASASALSQPSTAELKKDSTASSQTAKQAVDDILKSLKDKNKNLESKMSMPATNSTPAYKATLPKKTPPVLMEGYREGTMSWGAGFLDMLLIVAASLLCMIILLTITRVDLFSVLSRSTEKDLYIAMFGLFSLVTFVYMTVHRVFLGQTPGEWAFDQRLGTVEEQFQTEYIFRTALRSILAIATGFIVMPIISLVMSQDVLADITGLKLYHKA